MVCAVRLFLFVFLYHQVERGSRRKLYGKSEGNGFGGEVVVLLNIFYSELFLVAVLLKMFSS